MSRFMTRLAKLLRPGLYALEHPVAFPSEMNLWEENDDCDPALVGTPYVYRLSLIRIRNSDRWEGHDDEISSESKTRTQARIAPRDGPAVVFRPEELHPLELVRFLNGARRIRA